MSTLTAEVLSTLRNSKCKTNRHKKGKLSSGLYGTSLDRAIERLAASKRSSKANKPVKLHLVVVDTSDMSHTVRRWEQMSDDLTAEYKEHLRRASWAEEYSKERAANMAAHPTSFPKRHLGVA